MNIQNITDRQFEKTMMREKYSVIDYFSKQEYEVLFRRNNRSVSPEGKIRLYYKQDCGMEQGKIFMMNGKQYIIINQDADESGYFYSAVAKQCNAVVDIKGTKCPIALDKNIFDLAEGKVFNFTNGQVTVYTQLNQITGTLNVNDTLQAFGNWYLVQSKFIDGNIIYFYLEETAKAPVVDYKLTYTGVTELDLNAKTYQLNYVATADGVVVENPVLSYAVAPDDIATVNSKGLLTMLKEGTATVTATWNNVVCEKEINITSAAANYLIKISASSSTIKIGGSYKTLTAKFFDDGDNDITESTISGMSKDEFKWTCSIDGMDMTDDAIISWIDGSVVNSKRIKFGNDRTYLGKTLVAKCTVDNIYGEFEMEISI